MKAAFSTWRGSIAPLFDEAREVRLVEARAGRIIDQEAQYLEGGLPLRRALELEELGVRVLICGAISRPLLETLEANGIRVYPFLSGNVSDLVEAWLNGSLEDGAYRMPGCGGRGRRRRRRGGCPGRRRNSGLERGSGRNQ